MHFQISNNQSQFKHLFNFQIIKSETIQKMNSNEEPIKKRERVLKHSTSLQHLNQVQNLTTTQITKQIVIKASDFSTYFSIFLANSKGKDKFLSLFQYVFQFICTCCKHSDIAAYAASYKKKQLIDIAIYYNLKQSISSARKVFRLLRFLDEIKGLTKILKSDKPLLFIFLSTITYLCSSMYYVSDNILWFFSILVTSGAFDKSHSKSWKYRKNFFSLGRIFFYLIILVYSLWLQQQENQEKMAAIKKATSFDNQFDQTLTKLSLSHIAGRRKSRFLYLQLALSCMRLLMLISSLKLRGHQRLGPIFIAWCGVGSAILGFLKALYEKKIVLNIDNKQDSLEQHIVSISKLTKLSNIKFW